MKTLTLKIPATLEVRLSALARRRKTSKSALAREALERFLTGNGTRRQESFSDRIRDLIGIVEGPGDLSTNKKYFEGFGK